MRACNFKFLFFFLVSFSACNSISSNGEKENSSLKITDSFSVALKTKFLHADTVLLIGHTGRSPVKVEGTEDVQMSDIPDLLSNGKLNNKIIKKIAIVTGVNIDTLISILTPSVPDISNQTHCGFDPHHAILFKRGDSASFIRLCFTCQSFDATQDLRPLLSFDSTKWSRLEILFKSLDARYYQHAERDSM